MHTSQHAGIAENSSRAQAENSAPTLEELERRIEQLAADLQQIKSSQTCPAGQTQLSREPSTPSVPVSPPNSPNRPSPPDDRISFYACTCFLFKTLILDWWGFEVAVPQSKVAGLQRLKVSSLDYTDNL